MKIGESRTMKVMRTFFNVRGWIDYDRTRAGWRYIVDGLKKLFVPQAKEARDFNEVVKEMGLTEDDLEQKKKALLRWAYLMLLIASLLTVYTVYQLVHLHIMATILSLIVTALALILAFRYHFWYFQIKERKLGCSVREWYHIGLKGEKNE